MTVPEISIAEIAMPKSPRPLHCNQIHYYSSAIQNQNLKKKFQTILHFLKRYALHANVIIML